MPNIYLVALFAMLCSCAGSDPVRINVGSDNAFEKSLAEMQSSLNREEQVSLMVALLQIRMASFSSAEEARISVGGRQVLAADKMGAIDGLSYSEIMNLAEQSSVGAEVLE